MPPISSSRLAPRTNCSSPADSICASQVRKSCFGALLRFWFAIWAGRFMVLPFRSGGGALERSSRHGAHEVASIFGAGVDILERLDRLCGSFCGSNENVAPRFLAGKGGFRFSDAAWPRLCPADPD